MFGLFNTPSLPEEDELKIVREIKNAEYGTSAEIRVHLAKRLFGKSVLKAAQHTFKKLGMHQTELRNGVLIYVSLKDRVFAIIGDNAIHQCVTEVFWDEVRDEMNALFVENKPGEAICHGVKRAGEKLKHYFPASTINPNELSDEISRG